MKGLNTEERLEICNKCPIYKNGRCNSSLWLNPDTNEISTRAKTGYIRGCNCIMKIKARGINNHCVAGKW